MEQTESPFAGQPQHGEPPVADPFTAGQATVAAPAAMQAEQHIAEPRDHTKKDGRGTTIFVITISLVLVALILMILLAVFVLLRDDEAPVRAEVVYVPPAGALQATAPYEQEKVSTQERAEIMSAFLTYVQTEDPDSAAVYQSGSWEPDVSVRQGNHVSGVMTSAGVPRAGAPTFLAVYTTEGWRVVANSADVPNCEMINKYAFPVNVAPKCQDNLGGAVSVVER